MSQARATRPSLQRAVEWIALNDNPADHEDVDAVAGYISTILVADLFGIEAEKVARKVVAYRERAGK